MRRVEVWVEEKQETIVFVTNHLKLAATTIAAVHKERWQIELLFKALKQSLRIKTFVGTSPNASRWIPLVTEITEDEWSSTESRLEQLNGMLEALSALDSTLTPAGDEIAALARALWEAKGCPEGLPEEDWFRAERALKTKRESNAICLVS